MGGVDDDTEVEREERAESVSVRLDKDVKAVSTLKTSPPLKCRQQKILIIDSYFGIESLPPHRTYASV